jgi:hypothetical protein
VGVAASPTFDSDYGLLEGLSVDGPEPVGADALLDAAELSPYGCVGTAFAAASAAADAAAAPSAGVASVIGAGASVFDSQPVQITVMPKTRPARRTPRDVSSNDTGCTFI